MVSRNLSRLALLAAAAASLTGFAGTRYRAGVHPVVEKQLDYAAAIARSGREGEAGGYMQALLIGDEIKVAIMFEPESEPQRADAERALDGAAKMWERALDEKVTIRRTKSGERPDLVIHFQPNVEMDGRQVSGYIRWNREVHRDGEKWVGTFDGQVFARTTLRGRAMTMELMRNCLGHEMGHMFGLPDAAGDGAIMGPLNVGHPISNPNPAEIETVTAIREDARSIRPGYDAFAGAQHQLMIVPLDHNAGADSCVAAHHRSGRPHRGE